MSAIGPGTLKCIIAAATPAALAALREHAGANNIREAGEGAVLVYTALEPSELRDLLSLDTAEGESLLVLEFEKWSGFGTGIDREWLLARGH